MYSDFLPIEAISGLWEIIASVGMIVVASFIWMFQPR